jgi:hypothetical protein
VGWDWVHLVRRPLTGLLYQPWMKDDECGAVGGIRIGRGNRSTRRKRSPVPICPSQIPHDLTWARTWAATVGSRRLTTWAMAWPICKYVLLILVSVTFATGSYDRGKSASFDVTLQAPLHVKTIRQERSPHQRPTAVSRVLTHVM